MKSSRPARRQGTGDRPGFQAPQQSTGQPVRHQFATRDAKGILVRGVTEALGAIPVHFRTTTRIDGLHAGDLFSLNAVMGNTIEVQVVDTLNRLRHVWDPDGSLQGHAFVRSAQTFPDVRLVDSGASPVLGIELKGWYLLSREGEPSFRYAVSPDACAPQDLLAVVPWHLEHVLSGPPVVHAPYIEQARYVAQYRDWWWENGRRTRDGPSERKVNRPADPVSPYPSPKSRIVSQPVRDPGKNFGRVARIDQLMSKYTETMITQEIAGIPAEHWIAFFRRHAEARDSRRIVKELEQALERLGLERKAAEEVVKAVRRIVDEFPQGTS